MPVSGGWEMRGCKIFAFFYLIAGPTIFPAFGQQADTFSSQLPSSSSVPCKIDRQYSKFYILRFIIHHREITGLIICPVFGQQATMSFPRPSHAKLFLSFATSSPRPSPRLRLARRPVFVSPVAPSSSRPSPRRRLTRRPVIASPVASSSPRGHLIFVGPAALFCPMVYMPWVGQLHKPCGATSIVEAIHQ
ncbi:hypothetical protein OUZ56_030727 [Daphnia magna]|uniref:Uncharacterized protein n=1 Tax=Daphnia magna TaxID=35525 RepID=A0ABQ9ZS49_9CRUS|nr:hypothetical protein OUZ56_030725 [Daphnia magna]KAK4015755.1 hypothetical protein OUZ56_030727 [Daphnia magna]